MELADAIVVGSGCSGAMAAQTLVEGGARVLMLDGGVRDTRYADLVPAASFADLRRHDARQHRYLLGDDFESIPTGAVTTGAQLTPPRRFLIDRVDEFLRHESSTFFPMESLAYGGLGAGWGLGCCVFSDNELAAAGLPVTEMRDAYQTVADRIGICGAADDAQPYTFAHVRGIQPPPALHPSLEGPHRAYAAKKGALNARGFHFGRPALALLTEDAHGRRGIDYRDMEFYDDKSQAAWRAWIAVDRLRQDSRFAYHGGLLVTRFSDGPDGVEVEALRLDTRERVAYRGRELVLAAGVLGSARIVLRSLDGGGGRLPILSNPYYYTPCVVPSAFGTALPDRLNSMAQLSLFHDRDGSHRDVAMASLYMYRSLLLFRLLREVPLGMRDARALMNYLLPGFVIMGLHHPEAGGGDKWMALEADSASPTGDRLRTTYVLDDETERQVRAREGQFTWAMRQLGAYAIKRVSPGQGSSVHYAGSLPFAESDRPWRLDPSGRLHGTRHVFVADGSGFRFLPAKGPTFTLMAHAHLVARRLTRR